MARVSQSQKHAVSLIAHAVMAKDMAGKIEGFDGYYAFWLKQQSTNDRALVKLFLDELKRIPADLLKMMKEEKRNGTPS